VVKALALGASLERGMGSNHSLQDFLNTMSSHVVA
jgi:hypothetical protein